MQRRQPRQRARGLPRLVTGLVSVLITGPVTGLLSVLITGLVTGLVAGGWSRLVAGRWPGLTADGRLSVFGSARVRAAARPLRKFQGG